MDRNTLIVIERSFVSTSSDYMRIHVNFLLVENIFENLYADALSKYYKRLIEG